MSKGYYRCLNKFGDACEHALSRRQLQPEEVTEIGGKAKCPGKTQSGELCSEELNFIPPTGGFSLSPKLMMLVAAAVLIAALAGALIYLFGGDEPAPEVETPELVPESTDPWQVYKTLEEKSTILRGKPQ